VTSFSIYKRNFIYFFTSFIWTATLSVVPQIFFMSNYPEQKNTLLSLFLLLGTMASVIGILTSQANKFYYFINATKVRRKLLIVSCIFTIAVTFSALLRVKNLTAYFTCFILLKFISNLFYNYIDRLFVAVSNPQQLNVHVRANLLFQLLGIMVAPFYFSFFAAKTAQNIVLIWIIAFLSMLFIDSDLKNSSPLCSTGNPAFPKEKLSLYHKLFITYAVLILSATTMLISIIIYILKDYYKFSNTATKGGIIIGVISIFAVISVFMSGVLIKYANHFKNNHTPPIKFSVIPNIISLLIFIVTTLAFYFKVSGSFYFMLGLSAFSGISYGIVLSSTRNYASSDSKNNTGLISIYNNLANYASLVGFLLILPASLLTKALAMDFCKLMLGIILVFFGLSLLTLVLIILKSKSLQQIGGVVHD
jgi:hypothetical protein